MTMIRRAPKVLLHDHLDGGVRPATVVELAREFGYEKLPTTDVGGVGDLLDRRGIDPLDDHQVIGGVPQRQAGLLLAYLDPSPVHDLHRKKSTSCA
mgnify:CR=1 FL=1